MRERGSRVYDEQGNLLYVDGIILDITKRKESEERQQALLKAIPDILFRVTADGTYLDYHVPHGFHMFIDPQTVMGRNIHEVLPPEIAHSLSRNLAEVTATGQLTHFEYQLQAPQGLRDYERRVTAINERERLILVRDITRQKHAERTQQQLLEELTQVTHQQKIILDNTAAGICLIQDNQVMWVNSAMSTLCGYTSEALQQLPASYALSPEIEADFKAQVIPQLAHEGIARAELQIRHKDGSPRWLYAVGQVISADNPVRTLWVMHDMTERKAAEATLGFSKVRFTQNIVVGARRRGGGWGETNGDCSAPPRPCVGQHSGRGGGETRLTVLDERSPPPSRPYLTTFEKPLRPD
jgi:PAS domain S-box-containing protein